MIYKENHSFILFSKPIWNVAVVFNNFYISSKPEQQNWFILFHIILDSVFKNHY